MKTKLTSLFLFAAFLFVGKLSVHAQAIIKFDTTTIDYGKIEQGAEPLRKFTFENTGKEPLIISNALGSCGCTVPSWPKEPILPSQKSSIDVRYDTNRVGPFTKTVTLTTNIPEQANIVLTIKGEVTAKPADLAPKATETAPANGGH